MVKVLLIGKELWAKPSQNTPAGNHLSKLPIEDIAAGIYLVVVKADGVSQTLRLVVHK